MSRPHFVILVVVAAMLASAPADARWSGRVRRAPVAGTQRDPLATQQWRVGQDAPKATILFLHGLGSRPDNPLVRRLVGEIGRRGASYSVVAPWLRPVRKDREGKIVGAGTHTMSDQLQRARKVLREQRGPVVLMGHSFGGKAAMKLAREFPNKVACVVGLAPSVNMLYSYWKHLTGKRGLPDDPRVLCKQLDRTQGRLVQNLREARRSGDRDAIQGAREQLGYHTAMKDLVQFNEPKVERGIRTPTLVLQGTRDQAVSIHYARRFADPAVNPGVKLVELPGLDHGFMKYKPPGPLGLPQLDRRATEQATREMTARITGFIDQHLGARQVAGR